MTGLLGGFVLIVGAFIALTYALLEPELTALRSEQMKADMHVDGARVKKSTPVYDAIERVLQSTGWRPFTEEQLALAGIRTGVTQMVAVAFLVAAGFFVVVLGVTGSIALALLAAIVAPFAVKLHVSRRTAKRRERFAQQMAESMTLLSSALKAGMNVPNALATTAAEMEPPMGEELARVVNESRLGRDLVVGMRKTAERMQSPDFQWVSEAVSIQRDSGGRLSEILDQVTATFAERNELREKINALSAEGKMSGYVLMALPVAVGGMYSVVNPEYMMTLFTTGLGKALTAAALVMYTLGGLWLRQITKVRL